jgi:hypothetical protein
MTQTVVEFKLSADREAVLAGLANYASRKLV